MSTEAFGRKLLELGPDDCRYPFGDRAPYLFCGEPAVVGSSYCELHRLICTKDPDHGNAYKSRPDFAAFLRKTNVPKCMTSNDQEGLL